MTRRRSIALAAALLVAGLVSPPAHAQKMDERCTAVVLNRTAPVTPDGMFVMANLPVPAGAFRARVVCLEDGQTYLGASKFMQGVANGITNFGTVTFGEAEAPIPTKINLSVQPGASDTLTPVAFGVQLVATGTLVDGTVVDFTENNTGTHYITSNPNIATVANGEGGKSGFVTGISSGTVTITAINEGVIATIMIHVAFGDDADGDGIKDDFEIANAVNPGGANLARLPGTVVTASSFLAGFPATRAIDGNLQTSWFTASGDAANRRTTPYIEITLPQDVNLAQIRMFGNRERATGFDIFAGLFQVFDQGGAELLNTGNLVLPPPGRDLAVPLDLNGVRRVRFTSFDDESADPGLAEIQLISRPGGLGLDKDDPADAALDFDQDGLTNKQEYDLGTDIFQPDTDGDNLTDKQEVDGGTDPTRADTDGDGLPDGQELALGTDPHKLDSDGDGMPDGAEVALGLDPLRRDSNNNGVPDNAEDSDGDGISNLDELAENLDPGNPDSDGDGLKDGEEVLAGADGYITDPLKKDTDGDGMWDGFESKYGLNPLDPSDRDLDPDGDGLTNFQEFQIGTDPKNADRVPPTVLSVDPADGATGVSVNAAIVVRFSEKMQPESFTPDTAQLLRGGVPVTGTAVTVSQDQMSVTLRAPANLFTTTEYSILVNGVRDAAGNVMAAPFTSAFTTSNQGDLVRPTPITINPDADGAPVNSVIALQFSEPIDPATVTASSFVLYRTRDNAVVPVSRSVDPSGLVAYLTPQTLLSVGAQYRIFAGTGIQDLAGNALNSNYNWYFYTSLQPDTAVPTVLTIDPANGASGVPQNAIITIQMSERVDPASVRATTVVVTANGNPVPGALSLTDGERRIRFVSAAALASNTTHQITIDGIHDVAGNALPAPVTSAFTTGAVSDIAGPTITSVTPYDGASNIARNTTIRVTFSEPVDPITVRTDTFALYNQTTRVYLSGTVSLDATRTIATFTPSALLAPDTQFQIRVANGAGGVLDSSGNGLPYFFTAYFYTGEVTNDATPPSVTGVSPPNNATGVPLNSPVFAQISETVLPQTVVAANVTLTRTSGAGAPEAIAGAISLGGGTLIRFSPSAALVANTNYTFALNGIQDLAGNALPAFASTFKTSTSGVVDNQGPFVAASSPANGETGVALSPSIQYTFSERLNPITVNGGTMQLRRSGYDGILPVTIALDSSGTVVTMTPTQPLLPLTTYALYACAFYDVANNYGCAGNFANFTTTAGAIDTTPPTITLITPANNATGVGINVPVVITFSEAIDPSTLNPDTLAILINGGEVGYTLGRSPDNKVVTLDPYNPLPTGSVVTVVATNDIRDLAGNHLADFLSRFTVEPTLDTSQPVLIAVRPGNGAQDVEPDSPVTMFFSEPINPSTAPGAVFVASDGVLVNGALTSSAQDQVEQFTPAAPVAYGSLGELFVTSDLTDPAGNPLSGATVHTSYRVKTDPATVAPDVVDFRPVCCTAVPRNTIIMARFSEPIDPATVTVFTVQVKNGTNGLDVDGTPSVDASGTFFTFVPDSLLPAGQRVDLTFTTAVKDLTGTPLVRARGFSVYVATNLDTVAPTVTTVSPADTTTNVGVNAYLRIRFSRPVNPPSVDLSKIELSSAAGPVTAASISFGENDQLVTIVPNGVLTPSTNYQIKIDGVTDKVGNAVVPKTTHFQTGPGPDLVQPYVTIFAPTDSEVAAVNSVVETFFSEPVDPVTINDSTLVLYNQFTGQPVPTTKAIDPDGRRVVLTPQATLSPGVQHRINVTQGVLDVSGNYLQYNTNGYFYTSFQPDTVAPLVLSIDPANGATGVPTNVEVTIRMSEAIEPVSVDATHVTLKQNGTPVSGALALLDGGRRIRLLTDLPLLPQTAYTLTVTGLRDIAGNVMTAPVVVGFTTETGVDLVSPYVVATNPIYNAGDVPLDSPIIIYFSEPLNPLTVVPSIFGLRNQRTGEYLPGTVALDGTRSIATFTPTSPMPADIDFQFTVAGGGGGPLDSAGNGMASQFYTYFSTGERSTDVTAPSVVGVSPPSGAGLPGGYPSVPVNSTIYVRVSESLNPLNVNGTTVTLTSAGGPVAASVSLSDANRLITLDPTANLAAATTYTISVTGLADPSGNPLPTFTSTFKTSSSGTIDQTAPAVSSIVPANGATGVATPVAVVITFTEPLNPLSVNSGTIRITRNGYDGILPATLALSADGTTVTLTPTVTLLPNTEYRVWMTYFADVAGNQGYYGYSPFTTGAGATDTTKPTVTLVTPSNGATGVGINVPVVMTFSEPIDPATVNTSTFALFINGSEVSMPNPSRSADNTVIVLDPYNPLPAGAVVTLVATSDVKDLAGNRLNDFASQFTVEQPRDTTSPAVAGVRPGNGAQDVSPNAPVSLFFTEPIQPSTAPNGIFVGMNGHLIDGTRTASAQNQVELFTPTAPYPNGALGEVFVTPDLLDPAGNPLNTSFHSSFRVAADPATLAPTLDDFRPPCCSQVPANSVFTARFSEPMDAGTFDQTTVVVRNNTTGLDVPGTRSLDATGELFTFKPSANLTPGQNVGVSFTTGVKDAGGTPLATQRNFTVVVGATTDTTAPTVTTVSPADGTQGVGVNVYLRIRFSEPINPATVDATTITLSAGAAIPPASIGFGEGDQLVTIVPHAPLAPNTTYTVSVGAGVTDRVGNAVVPKSTTFKTGAGPDLVQPIATICSPVSGSEPTNSVIAVTFSEPIDPATVGPDTFGLAATNNNGVAIPGTRTLDAGGSRLLFVPDAPIVVSQQHRIYATTGLQDATGNPLQYYTNCYFTTGAATDVTAPTVVATDPANAAVGVPTNAEPTIQMSEPVDTTTVTPSTVTLKRGATVLAAPLVMQDANRRIHVTPTQLLQPSSVHTLTIGGLRDTAGNVMAAPVVVTFTTGPGADLVSPAFPSTTPVANATGVSTAAVVTIVFSEPMNPITINSGTITLFVNAGAVPVASTLALDAARTTLTLTPTAALAPNTLFRLQIVGGGGGVLDTAANGLPYTSQTYFTTGP